MTLFWVKVETRTSQLPPSTLLLATALSAPLWWGIVVGLQYLWRRY